MGRFLEHVKEYYNGTIVARGQRIFRDNHVHLTDVSETQAFFEVEGSQPEPYEVSVEWKSGDIHTTCTCPYGAGCKHRVAALFFLDKYYGELAVTAMKVTDPKPSKGKEKAATPVKRSLKPAVPEAIPDEILLGDIKLRRVPGLHAILDPSNIISAAKDSVANQNKIRYRVLKGQQTLKMVKDRIEIILDLPQERANMIFEVRQGKAVYSYCSCSPTQASLCIHRAAALLRLVEENGPRALIEPEKGEKEKKEFLRMYGYKADDPEVRERFEFINSPKGLKVQMRKDYVLPLDMDQIQLKLPVVKVAPDLKKAAPMPAAKQQDTIKAGFLIRFNDVSQMLPFVLVPFTAKISKAERLNSVGFDLGNFSAAASDEDFQLLRHVDLLKPANIINAARQQHRHDILQSDNFFAASLYWDYVRDEDVLPLVQTAIDHFGYVRELMKNVSVFANKSQIIHDPSDRGYFHHQSLPVRDYFLFQPREEIFRTKFVYDDDKKDVILFWECYLGDKKIDPAQIQRVYAAGVLIQNGESFDFAFAEDPRDIIAMRIAMKLPAPVLRVRKQAQEAFVRKILFPFMRDFVVDIRNDFRLKNPGDIAPVFKVLLSETADASQLQFSLIAQYDTHQVYAGDTSSIIYEQDGQFFNIDRDKDAETAALELMSSLHPEFLHWGHTYSLAGKKVLEDNWFFEAFKKLKEAGFEVFGLENLRAFRYNPYPIRTTLRTSSGLDWFDIKLEVAFGDQIIGLKDVRKALINGSRHVRLGDGSIGILPEEWIQKYGALLRLGEADQKALKLSKVHFNVLDALGEDIDNAAVLRELADKKAKLLSFDTIQKIPVPTNIQAKLRDYQQNGLNWLNFLDEFGWGGCLADDMGLGKTLQIISFLQLQKEKGIKGTSLIVLPTSLIYNWVKELQKFAPSLQYLVHYGGSRAKDSATFDQYDLILSSYGNVVKDVPWLSNYTFHYIILDESQLIKNVTSERYRNICKLKSRNRIVMSGTPVENNTSELYAQFNFLNPGMLGSYEFFKEQYAGPIDRKGDESRVKELRRLVYPFMLRRTKESVAKDLPDKTETILYCEMEPAQRRVYDAFRNQYRESIMQLIEEEGLEKSGMHILQGLIKLRQICNSPALLKEQESYGEQSVKLEEIMRHLEEITPNHKVLVFSFFLDMLELIKKRLEQLHIPYVYLDGQTKERQELVDEFQQNPDQRVFLMSLKAGGVGLNLTAAEYVFLVDPWWNPAVEKQAIDRTHRIGQTNKVFAYKMICKDTIEEKILQLQEKKKNLADDLISTETAIFKKLTKEDIRDLFS